MIIAYSVQRNMETSRLLMRSSRPASRLLTLGTRLLVFPFHPLPFHCALSIKYSLLKTFTVHNNYPKQSASYPFQLYSHPNARLGRPGVAACVVALGLRSTTSTP